VALRRMNEGPHSLAFLLLSLVPAALTTQLLASLQQPEDTVRRWRE